MPMTRPPSSRATIVARATFGLTALVMGPGAAAQQSREAAPVEEREVVEFKTVGDVTLHLHLWRPAAEAPAPRPAVVFFFGGGWRSGTPNQFAPHCARLAAEGFVAFSAEYRVGKRHGTTPFECVKDGKSAIRWVREHAADYGVDPRRILAAGGSAGGHVAACTGLIRGFEVEDEGDPSPQTSSVPDAMVLFNPVLDTGPEGYRHPSLKERFAELSPQHQVRAGLPPTLIFHGTGDVTVAFEQAERFGAAMREHDNRCEVVLFEGMEHGFFNEGRHENVPFEKTLADTMVFVRSLGWLPPPSQEEGRRSP